MGATLIKIKPRSKIIDNKPLSPLQKKQLAGPVMTEKELTEFKKVNTCMKKWKV